MSLSDLASLGSFVSGVAVAVTLVMLLLQMRQTDRHQRASMQLGRATRGTELFSRLIDPQIARVFRKAVTSIEPLVGDDLFVWLFYSGATFFNWQDTFFQYRAGVLDKASIESEEAHIRFNMAFPAWRASWEIQKIQVGPEFARYLDRIIAELPMIAPGEADPLYATICRDLLSKTQPVSAGTLSRSGRMSNRSSPRSRDRETLIRGPS